MVSPITADAVRHFLLERYSAQIASRGLTPATVPDDYDLLAEGIIDSLGILEMLSAVAKYVGFDLDLDSLEADKVTIVGPFSRHVHQLVAARG